MRRLLPRCSICGGKPRKGHPLCILGDGLAICVLDAVFLNAALGMVLLKLVIQHSDHPALKSLRDTLAAPADGLEPC